MDWPTATVLCVMIVCATLMVLKKIQFLKISNGNEDINNVSHTRRI